MQHIGQNDACHCGSGKKYKKCCLTKDEEQMRLAKADEAPESGYELFGVRFPEIAEKETRNLTIMDSSDFNLPKGIYIFHEMFCCEHGCDCRRVFFYVTFGSQHDLKAVVFYGWESPDFYRKWYNDDDPEMIAEMKGPALNMNSPQSKHAPEILRLVKNVLIKDKDYMDRVKRHYDMFKAEVDRM